MEDINFLMREEDLVLSAALAFTLEFLESDKPAFNVSIERKPTQCFNGCDEMAEDYTPQCDLIETSQQSDFLYNSPSTVYDYLNDNDIEVIESSESVSISSSEHRQSQIVVTFEKVKSPPRVLRSRKESIKSPSKGAQKTTKSNKRMYTEPTRGSSRLMIQKIAREEAAKKEAKKSSTPPKKSEPKKRGRPRKTKKRVEPVAVRRKREKEERAQAEVIRKQRKIMADATKSVLRTFGVVASLKSKSGKLHLSTWRKWIISSCQYMRQLAVNPESCYDSQEFHVFLVNSVTVMQHTLVSYRPRPEETHELMLGFIGDFAKIWNLASRLGATKIMGDVGRLFEYVLGHFIAHPQRMQPTNLPWIQTKVILDKILSIITRVDVIYDVMILLNKMMANFLGKWARKSNECLEFKSYALSTFHSFFTILNGRLAHISLQKSYLF